MSARARPRLEQARRHLHTLRLSAALLAPSPRAGNVLEYKDQKLVYKRYASLFFVMGIGKEDNELM